VCRAAQEAGTPYEKNKKKKKKTKKLSQLLKVQISETSGVI